MAVTPLLEAYTNPLADQTKVGCPFFGDPLNPLAYNQGMFEIKVDTSEIERGLRYMQVFSQRRINSVFATALSKTASIATKKVKSILPQFIDRPTRYTMNGIFQMNASARNLSANIYFGEEFKKAARGAGVNIPASYYMYFQVYGGMRRAKRWEKALQKAGVMPGDTIAVPTRQARINEYGNVSSGQITQILSQLTRESSAGYTRSLPQFKKGMTAREARDVANKRRRAFGRAGGQFLTVPYSKGGLKAGIYLATGYDAGAKGGFRRTGKLTPIFYFQSAAFYKKRYPFHETIQEVFRENFSQQLDMAIIASGQRLAAREGIVL